MSHVTQQCFCMWTQCDVSGRRVRISSWCPTLKEGHGVFALNSLCSLGKYGGKTRITFAWREDRALCLGRVITGILPWSYYAFRGYKPIRQEEAMLTDGQKGVETVGACWYAASSHITNVCWEIQLLSALPKCTDLKKKKSIIHKHKGAVCESRCNQGSLLVLQVLVLVQVQGLVQEQGSSPPLRALPSNC